MEKEKLFEEIRPFLQKISPESDNICYLLDPILWKPRNWDVDFSLGIVHLQ